MNQTDLRKCWDQYRLIKVEASNGCTLVAGKLDITDDTVYFGVTGWPGCPDTELKTFLALRGISWPYSRSPASFEELMTQVNCALELIGKTEVKT
jgi:hypothetical protein